MEQQVINKWRKAVAGARQCTSLLEMVEMGMSTKEMKQAVIATLEPFFSDGDILGKLALPALVGEAVEVSKLGRDPWAFGMYRRCLDLHRAAQAVAGDESVRVCASWEPAVSRGLWEYWSALHLEVAKHDLALEEFKYEILRNVGMVIEAVMQPHLRELLDQVRLRDRYAKPERDVEDMTLGAVVDELADTCGFAELLAPPPWNVRLNEWRNIAKHHSSRVEGKTIVCAYGRAPKVKQIRLSRDELQEAAQRIFNAFRAVKLARTIFFVDNAEAGRVFVPDVDVPPEAHLLNFASAVATQGFEVVDVKLTDQEARVALREVSDLDPDQRRFHASQFVYVLWMETDRRRVTVEYQEKDGTCSLLTTASAEDCERVAEGEIEACELANLVEVVDVKTGRSARRPRNDGRALPGGDGS